MLFKPKDEFEDINNIINGCGFTPLDENIFFYWGLGGKGPVGKGWFLGGQGAWYDTSVKRIVPSGGIKRMALNIGYGGVTLDKRIPFSRKFLTSIGFMLGWGGYKIDFSQIGEDYNWDSLSTQLTSSDNNYIQITKNYILFQPRMAFLLKINDWLGIRTEAGYMFSYSFYKGWRANICEDTFEIADSPNTKFDGYTFSIGPWFGF